MQKERTWLNGDYKDGYINLVIVRADDDQITMRPLKFLDAEPTADCFITWEPKNDDTIIINDGKETAEAKISADKKTIIGGPGILGHLAWITPEEAEVIRNRPKQSVAAPEVPYPLNPGKVGNLVIVSGPPGSGKSTIAAMLADTEKWVYYEGDGFVYGFNPYLSRDESQVEARSERPALIGPGMHARGIALGAMCDNQDMLYTNQTTDRQPTDYFYRLMASDINTERRRIGGDWVVSFALADRHDRDIFREVLGADIIFVVLDISFDLVKKRLHGREFWKDTDLERLSPAHQIFKPAESDEPNTIGFEVLDEATKEENAQRICDLIAKECAN